MKYTVPDYYREFSCIADKCPATCCAGWQIVIDEKTLKKYKNCKTAFGNRLANSIDWEEGVFHQYNGRCAFLDERNLCDIYTEAGEDMFCKTCRLYPRHIEEFENEREISLSISCPVAAELVLGNTEKVTFVSKETEQKEEEEDFDFFLYSALQDCRSVMLEILQNRELDISFRMAKVLALAHDVQGRIDGNRIFEIEELLERYMRQGADEKLERRFSCFMETRNAEETTEYSRTVKAIDSKKTEKKETNIRRVKIAENKTQEFCRSERYTGKTNEKAENENTVTIGMSGLMSLLDELEVLDPSWPMQLSNYRNALYANTVDMYESVCTAAWKLWKSSSDFQPDVEQEQLMVYFLFTYFCGAVYDGDVFAKVKMAIVSTLLIREMEYAEQKMYAKPLTLFDRTRIAWRYSRELEHSDPNLNKMEELMNEREEAGFENLLELLLSY